MNMRDGDVRQARIVSGPLATVIPFQTRAELQRGLRTTTIPDYLPPLTELPRKPGAFRSWAPVVWALVGVLVVVALAVMLRD